MAALQEVFAVARRLRSELGRRPSLDEIARASGRSPHAVRRALEHGQRAGQPPALPRPRTPE
ncbi:sigma-70 domain-containing protein [Chondromyces crocatus]|uniref:sigma-70 domain-containing protein n=1 Tax=Chondromyces crocatus TaxID=52 RepID=UPI003CCBF6B3